MTNILLLNWAHVMDYEIPALYQYIFANVFIASWEQYPIKLSYDNQLNYLTAVVRELFHCCSLQWEWWAQLHIDRLGQERRTVRQQWSYAFLVLT